MDWNADPKANDAFRQMFSNRAEISPLGQAGNSHFGYVQPLHPDTTNPGWHATTQIPGLKQGMPISIHDPLKGLD